MAFNTDLIDDLAREKVVLFLGAGVSSSAVTAAGGRIAGWDAFLRQTSTALQAETAAQVISLLDKKDYLLACEIMQKALSDDWADRVAREFGQRATPSELHKALVELKQRIVLTTNFDKLLEGAWETIDTRSTHYPSVISTIDDTVFKVLKDHSKQYIIKLHGTIDTPSGLIFSRSEYIRSAFGSARYSGFLETLLLNYTFLFVGFSMDDPAVSSLMELYALRYPIARPHYILSPSPIEENILEINKRLRKLVHILYDPAGDHAELTPLIRKLAKIAAERRREIFAIEAAH